MEAIARCRAAGRKGSMGGGGLGSFACGDAFDGLCAGHGDGRGWDLFEHPALFAVNAGIEAFDFVAARDAETDGFVDEEDEDESADGGVGGGGGSGDELFEELARTGVCACGVEEFGAEETGEESADETA